MVLPSGCALLSLRRLGNLVSVTFNFFFPLHGLLCGFRNPQAAQHGCEWAPQPMIPGPLVSSQPQG